MVNDPSALTHVLDVSVRSDGSSTRLPVRRASLTACAALPSGGIASSDAGVDAPERSGSAWAVTGNVIPKAVTTDKNGINLAQLVRLFPVLRFMLCPSAGSLLQGR